MNLSELQRVAAVIAKNKPQINMQARLRTPDERTCKNCDILKPIEDFYERQDYSGGYLHICKRCHNIQTRKAKQAKGLLR